MTIWWSFKIVIFPKSAVIFETFHSRDSFLLLHYCSEAEGQMREEKYKAANTSRKNYPLTELTETIMTKIFYWIGVKTNQEGMFWASRLQYFQDMHCNFGSWSGRKLWISGKVKKSWKWKPWNPSKPFWHVCQLEHQADN